MNKRRKGIILAGGLGTRLYPLTKTISKQLLPVYDKPMIYYPLTTLMLSGIREFLLICTPRDLNLFKSLLGDGSSWGISINFQIQEKPEGIAQAFLISKDFLDDSPSALILGDNIFYGNELYKHLNRAYKNKEQSSIFVYRVIDPERYGVAEFDNNFQVVNIEEKPKNPKTNFAVTGLYFYDKNAPSKAELIKPSNRGELEISTLNNLYLRDKSLKVEVLGRGMAWLDTGTFDSLQEAGSFIKTLEKRQGLKIGAPEEIAWRQGWINDRKLELLSSSIINSDYGKYLLNLLKDKIN